MICSKHCSPGEKNARSFSPRGTCRALLRANRGEQLHDIFEPRDDCSPGRIGTGFTGDLEGRVAGQACALGRP